MHEGTKTHCAEACNICKYEWYIWNKDADKPMTFGGLRQTLKE